MPPCPSRSTSGSPWARRLASSTATSTCGAREPPLRVPPSRLRSKVNAAAPLPSSASATSSRSSTTLTRSTPEGARDFLVPARLAPGSWYALPQSPQLLKQLLMVAGMERYYQIARCYRDEDFRADRQPEFTQLDIEGISFVEQADVLELGEAIVILKLIDVELDAPFEQLTYADAMRRFGSDKPDLRFGNELVECTDYWWTRRSGCSRPSTSAPWSCPAVPRSRASSSTPGRTGPRARRQGSGLRVGRRGRGAGRPGRQEPLRRGEGRARRPRRCPARRTASSRRRSDEVLARPPGGAARLEIGRRCELIDESASSFLWVLDAPLFEPASEAVAAGDVAVGGGAGRLSTTPSPRPRPSSWTRSTPTPAPRSPMPTTWSATATRSGVGPIRIHRRDIQERVFKVMGLSDEEAQEKFGFLLDAFAFGAPPHGGIAFGLGPHASRCSPAPSRSATSSRSPSRAVATTR